MLPYACLRMKAVIALVAFLVVAASAADIVKIASWTVGNQNAYVRIAFCARSINQAFMRLSTHRALVLR